jgi:hypothetical protein
MSWEIASYIGTFIAGVLVGALGQYLSDHATDRRRDREARSRQRKNFQRLQAMMPALIEDIKRDLTINPEVRDVAVLSSSGVAFNWPQTHFCYYQNVIDDLRGKFTLLEQAGYLERQSSNVPVYRMTQEFVDLVVEP